MMIDIMQNTQSMKSLTALYANRPKVSVNKVDSPLIKDEKSKSLFFKDSFGGIYDSYQRKLINSTPYNIDIDENGFIYDKQELIGQISLLPEYPKSIPSYYPTANYSFTDAKIDEIVAFREFQANLKIVKVHDEMLGTVINLKA